MFLALPCRLMTDQLHLVERHAAVVARKRVLPNRDHWQDGYMFTGEFVSYMNLDNIDYNQVRRLLNLIRKQAGIAELAKHQWARYTLLDIAAMERLLDLVGGRSALQPGRRLRLRGVSAALGALRARGFTNPLLQVNMAKVGSTVVAQVDGTIFDPISGQQLLVEVMNSHDLQKILGADVVTEVAAEIVTYQQASAAPASSFVGSHEVK